MAAFIDIAILVIAAYLAFMGYRRGLIDELFLFAALLGGFLVSFMYYRDVQSHFSAISSNQHAVDVTAFLVVFVLVSLAIRIVGFFVRKLVKAVMLGWVDRIFGVILGLLKTCVIAWALCLSISSIPVRATQDEFGRSLIYRAFKASPDVFSLQSMESARAAIRHGKKTAVDIGGGKSGGAAGDTAKTKN
ncbi:MAG: CvpA family protein [Chitinispirillales bacterium]|nr:CvpA family protein [Chitinispirillales bacterium]